MLSQPFRLKGSGGGCSRFHFSFNVFRFTDIRISAYLINMRRSVSNSPNTLLDIQRALQAKRLAEVLVADEIESENQQQESVTTKFVVFIVFNHGFCSGPLGHIVFSTSWLLPLSCPSVVFASAQSASGELSGLISTVFY